MIEKTLVINTDMPVRPIQHRPPGYRERTIEERNAERHAHYDRWRGTAEERGYGADWKRLRNKFITANPLCIACEAEGRITVAAVVDHIVEVSVDPSRRLDVTNLRSLCHPHHQQRHRDDRRKTPKR